MTPATPSAVDDQFMFEDIPSIVEVTENIPDVTFEAEIIENREKNVSWSDDLTEEKEFQKEEFESQSSDDSVDEIDILDYDSDSDSDAEAELSLLPDDQTSVTTSENEPDEDDAVGIFDITAPPISGNEVPEISEETEINIKTGNARIPSPDQDVSPWMDQIIRLVSFLVIPTLTAYFALKSLF